ncbi:MAG TPA: HDOD domain-containing protein, partial [Tepidisphaeraceae bacterium]
MVQGSDQLREKRAEVILQQLDDIPPLPDVVKTSLGKEGGETALANWLFETFQTTAASRGPFNRQEFWKHSIAVACCAELLAEQLVATWGKDCAVEPAELFLCGLIHDLGKLAFDVALPKSYARAVETADLLRGNIADVERAVIGIDHLVVGKRLAERWELPPTLRDAIWLHGQLPQALPATVRKPRVVNLVTLADLIAREQHLGYSGNYLFNQSRQALADAIGLTPEQVAETAGQIVERIEPRAAALGFGQARTAELYQQALERANHELGRVASQLETKNKRLAIRAKFFNDLSEFQAELKADAPPQTVMRAIGQTAVSFLGVTSTAVFSLMPGQDYAEVMLFDSHGDVFETTLVDCPTRPARPAPGEGPVLSAGVDLDWILSAISPRLAFTHRYWICLEGDNNCIGGIVWGAMAGEASRLCPQAQELTAITCGWGLSLRTAQIREEARLLAEQLAEANRRLEGAQAEIMRSKMMSTVGEMAAGAAHEMNNPLAVISGRSQLLASQISDAKQKAAAHLIHEQAHRLTDIITELMDFAKPVPPKPAEVDVADLIDRALHEAKLHNDPADRTIEVTIGDVPNVVVDKEQIIAALVEVIENSLAATDATKGHLNLHAAFDAYSLRVAVTVTDDGVGMDENTLRRAFDPFFSMRPAGRRRGMGLPKAQRWI